MCCNTENVNFLLLSLKLCFISFSVEGRCAGSGSACPGNVRSGESPWSCSPRLVETTHEREYPAGRWMTDAMKTAGSGLAASIRQPGEGDPGLGRSGRMPRWRKVRLPGAKRTPAGSTSVYLQFRWRKQRKG